MNFDEKTDKYWIDGHVLALKLLTELPKDINYPTLLTTIIHMLTPILMSGNRGRGIDDAEVDMAMIAGSALDNLREVLRSTKPKH